MIRWQHEKQMLVCGIWNSNSGSSSMRCGRGVMRKRNFSGLFFFCGQKTYIVAIRRVTAAINKMNGTCLRVASILWMVRSRREVNILTDCIYHLTKNRIHDTNTYTHTHRVRQRFGWENLCRQLGCVPETYAS